MGSSRIQGGRLAAVVLVALLIAASNTALVAAFTVPAESPSASFQEWTGRLGEAAARNPLALGLLAGVPAVLVLVCLGPLAARTPRASGEDRPARSAMTTLHETPTPDPTEALRLLAFLQRGGRFVDFLQEDITPYDDAQIGAAVREIQAGCRDVLRQWMGFEPVLAGEEGSTVTIEAGFDTTAIRVTGNVSGDPPFHGILRHGGWKAARVNWPVAPPKGRDLTILSPAEVEIP